jgi:hypothetical protein
MQEKCALMVQKSNKNKSELRADCSHWDPLDVIVLIHPKKEER